MSKKIFISYRREDSRGATGRIYDRLEGHFGRERIFMDVDAIRPGMDFVDAIEDALSASDVFLVMIGPQWVTSVNAQGERRLENPDDFVRLEVASALARAVRVIPVLVDNATMPRSDDLPDNLKPVTRRNAIEISHTRFNLDAQRLIRAIEDVFAEHSPVKREEPEPKVLQKQREDTSRTETPKSSSLQVLTTIIYWTVGGFVGGMFHWYPYEPISRVFLLAGMSGLLSGIGLGLALRNRKPDSWILQGSIALVGNIIVGSVIRGLFTLHIGETITLPLLLPPIATGILYGVWKRFLRKT